MSWKDHLPMEVYEDGDDENDFAYDDGVVWFFGTVNDDRLVIHDLTVKDRGLRQARTGLGRLTCQKLRPHFNEIIASGVGEFIPDVPIEEQKPYLFWKAMLDEELIDGIIPMYGDIVRRPEAASPRRP
jgi:hypothetical protein